MQNHISLALIVKAANEEAKKLDTALASVGKTFDEICITITGNNKDVENVAKKYNANISHFEWIDDFAAARNYNFAQCSGDWIVWMDADDTFRGLENLRQNIDLAEKNNVEGLSMLYEYKVDKNGKVEDKHWKVQAIKNNNHAEWRGIIHEDLIGLRPAKWARIKDVVRVHHATEKDSQKSMQRNLHMLLAAVEKEPDEPRHYFYLARCYLGTEEWEKVLDVVKTYLTLSGWKQERYEALNMAGEAYMRLGMYDEALQTHTDATLQLENAPDAYIYKARVYIRKEEWKNALACLEIAESRDPNASPLKRTALYDHDLYLLSSVAYLNLGKYKEAMACAKQAYNNRKTDKPKELYQVAAEMERKNELARDYRKIGEQLLEDQPKLKSLINSVPDEIRDDPRILALDFSVNKRTWGDDEVTIFCGMSSEMWDGDSINKGGIGGSETAVVEIARRLVTNGKKVTVYNYCDAPPEGKVVDGVLYRPYWQFNKEDTFNVLWLWRSPDVVRLGVSAKKIIVDMHDVSTEKVFDGLIDKIDHVFVKSEYHKSLYPSIPDEKFVVVGNGIDMKRFNQTVEKKNNRFIYTSTPNRGLENILDVWPEIRAQIPDAELHIYYGWNTYYEFNKHNPPKIEWMKTMQRKMEQDGIVNHGRVGQKELAQDQLASSLWLYPTEFPEIHCITALEMQAAKVYPITTGYAALAETQVSGIKLEGDPKTDKWREKFVKEIVFAYENPDTLKNELKNGYSWAKENSWDNVTETWMKYL